MSSPHTVREDELVNNNLVLMRCEALHLGPFLLLRTLLSYHPGCALLFPVVWREGFGWVWDGKGGGERACARIH